MADLLGITLRQLHVLVRVAECGSFASAAKALDVAPPSISGHIGALELRCGAIFERHPGGRISLTPAGTILLRRATAILAEVDALGRELHDVAGPPSTVRIAAADYLYGRLKEIAAAFLVAHPGMGIQARIVASAREGMEALRTGDAELFFVTEPDQGTSSDRTMVGPATVGLYATPALVARHGLLRPDARLPMLVSTGGADGVEMVKHALDRSGIAGFEIVGRAQHVQISRAMCLQGAGVALLYDDLVRDDVADGALVRLPRPVRCLWWHCHCGRVPTPSAAQMFLDYARARLACTR